MVGDVLGVRPQLYRRLGRRELPAVRARDLPAIGRASDGRIPLL